MTAIDNTRGALLMVAATAAFTVSDALMKLLAAEVPVLQAIALRGVLATVLFIVVALRAGALRVRIGRPDAVLVGLRALADTATSYFFLTALAHMPLADLTAMLQALPLTVTLAAAVFLREPLGWRRMTAIVVGFAGVLLIVRPGPGGFDLYALYGLAAVVFITLRDVLTRRLSAKVPSLVVALVSVGAVTVAAAASGLVTGDWVALSPATAGYVAGSAVAIFAGYLSSVMAMRRGELGFVSPFRYTSLVWALMLGLAVFGDWPDALTMTGAAIVVATGLYAFHRERARARRPAAPGA